MGSLHPQVVHFAVALLFLGVLIRAISLLVRDRLPFVSPMATTLLVLGTAAAVVAAMTGDAAHAPVEAMPGLRPIVSEHEEWGEWARNIFLVVFLLEVAALLVRQAAWLRYLTVASTIVGLVGLGALYEAAEHGGQIVYSFAGGVGTRSGDPEDVNRLFLAGLYQQTLADRKAGRSAEANRWIEIAAQRFPDNIDVQIAAAESVLLDRKDAASAVRALQDIHPPADNRPLRVRHAMLTADALVATGQREGAIAVLQQVLADGPSPRVQQKLDQLKAPSGQAPQP